MPTETKFIYIFMNGQRVLNFMNRLAANNNREWFNEHKEEYLAIKTDLETFTNRWLEAMAEIDPETQALQAKDCMYRIYRDTRFSKDKTPYKDWIGIIVAPKGGRKSPYGCYYLHFQPGHCMFAGGVWCPEPDLIKGLRQDIYDNMDELEELFSRPEVAPFFQGFDDDGKLKRVPSPYPADTPHPDWISRKSFTFSYPLTDEQIASPQLMDLLLQLCRAAQPLNKFLDYTVEEWAERT